MWICQLLSKEELEIGIIFFKALNLEYVNGACTQNIYHFTEPSLLALKEYLFKKGVAIRYDN